MGVTAATGADVEKRRALFKHCKVPRARLGSMFSGRMVVGGGGEGFGGQWQWEEELKSGRVEE